MSRRFRRCVAKGGRGYFRPSYTYRQPKFTLFSQKKRSVFEPLQKSISPTISEIEPHQFPKLWEIYFFATPHNFANRPHFVALIQLGRPKQGQTFVVPTFQIHLLLLDMSTFDIEHYSSRNENIHTKLFDTSHPASKQMTTVNIFQLSLSTKMLSEVMVS